MRLCISIVMLVASSLLVLYSPMIEKRNTQVIKCTVQQDVLHNPPYKTHDTCPRFLLQIAMNIGVGHMFGCVLFGAKLAKDNGAALVLDDNIWTRTATGHHGRYPYFRTIFQLKEFYAASDLKHLNLTLSYISFENRSSVYKFFARNSSQTCNVVGVISTGNGVFCDGTFCFRNWPGVYQEMQPLFNQVHKLEQVYALSVRTSAYYTPIFRPAIRVVWHVRASDISLHKNDVTFFENLASCFRKVANTTRAVMKHVFLTGDHNSSQQVSAQPPPGFEFLSGTFKGAMFSSSRKADVDLFYFTTADILVSTGSSFAHTAALLAPPSLIYIETPFKGGGDVGTTYWETMHLKNAIIASNNGTISPLDFLRLTQLVRLKLSSNDLL